MSYVEVGDKIYIIGDPIAQEGLNCNPYLLIDEGEGILIDPGSVLDFPIVLENLKQLIDIRKISHVILHHQDPDFCSAVPLLEKEGLNAQVVTTWKCQTLVKYYGIQMPYYLIEEHEMQLRLKSGRILSFILTPYLHFAGAFVTYDMKTRSLFSSDLFGSFSYNPTLYADDHYMDKMLSFHEHYMPSNAVLRPVMELISLYQIETIFPQHGSIIKDQVYQYIEALKTLECGSFLTPVKKNLMQSGGFTMIFNEVYKRMISIFPSEDVNEIFDTIDGLEFNEQKVITGYRQDWNLIWNSIFNKVQSIKGMVWLGVLFPFVENLCAVFDLQLPEVFSKSLNEILNENDKLKQVNISLDQTIKATNNKLLRCPITGLYNETFFHSLLLNEFGNEDWREIGILAFIGIDDFADYIIRFGNQEEQIVLNNLAYLLKEDFGENAVYRMDLPDFALYLKGLTRQEVVERLEKIRVKVNKGDYFLGKITISAGVAFPPEIDLNSNSNEIAANQYENLAFERLRTAQLTGKNKICSEGEKGIQTVRKGKILIADTDITNVTLLKTYFEEADLEVMTTDNGIEAKEMAIANLPDVIVSEVILHRLDGFSLREELLNNSTTKDIKTVFLSFKKDETSVKRAIQMGVTHYLSKPFLLAELLGIVESLVQDGKKWN